MNPTYLCALLQNMTLLHIKRDQKDPNDMCMASVGIGSLTLRTDTSFTLGPLEGTRVSIYLSICMGSNKMVQTTSFGTCVEGHVPFDSDLI